MKRTMLMIAVAASLGAAGCADMGGLRPAKTEGDMLVGNKGMTLYTYDHDPVGAGKSDCNGVCARNWPPLEASVTGFGHGDWSIVKREDGTKQWAYKGHPLYYFIRDKQPGDTHGNGFRGVWHVARP